MLSGIKAFEKNFSTFELPTANSNLNSNTTMHSLRRSFSCDEMTDSSFWESRTCNEAAESSSSSSKVFFEQFSNIENKQLSAVKAYCEKISKFIPLYEIEGYGYTNASLACTFDKIGFSFAFLPEVRDVLLKYLGDFKDFAPMIPIESSPEQLIQACYELLQVVDANLEKVHEESLKSLWAAICLEQKWDNECLFFSTSQIQDYLKNPARNFLRYSLSMMDLRQSEIQILPPEILMFTNLQRLILDGSQIHETPHIVSSNKSIEIFQYQDNFWRYSDTATWQSQLSISDISSSSEETDLENEETYLQEIWTRIISEYPAIPELDTEEDIRAWLDNPLNGPEIAQIYRLDLSNLGLTEVPDIIGKFTHLRILDLSKNWLKELPETLANLSQLIDLKLTGNEFTDIPPVVQKLSKLSTLNMSENKLESLPDWICTCKNILYLYIERNQISSLPHQIGELENLVSLTLQTNQLTKLPASIANLSKLEVLFIDENPLQAIPSQLYSLNLKEFCCEHDLYRTIPHDAPIMNGYIDEMECDYS